MVIGFLKFMFEHHGFSVGNGLPVTSIEISFIERLRARREWEQDHTIDLTRTKIVIEREMRQWQMRENEIKTYEFYFNFKLNLFY